MQIAESKSLWVLRKKKFCEIDLSIQILITVLSCSIFAHENSKTIGKNKNELLQYSTMIFLVITSLY